MGRRAALVVIGFGMLAAVAGCAAQDELIGEGPASLIFENSGSDTIAVRVEWDDETGERQHRSFDLWGKVELRLADRTQYRVILDARCDADCATQEVEGDEQADPEPVEAGPGGAGGVP